jgi:arginine N-succinyltransferase
MLLLRDVQKSDLPALRELAAVLNTVNLPDDEESLEALIDRSIRSFSGRIRNPLEREYLFVLEDIARRRIIGSSIIIAQHGTREAPHVFFNVSEREHYSASLDKHLRHKVLSIGYHYDGPTEIGGLVVEPASRGTPERPGKQLSYVRFLFIAMHRKNFRDRVLAELLPPLMPDGRSHLWESVGSKFTGLTYQEADLLSRRNKEFIKELFPHIDIYATLLPKRAQEVLGEVGVETRGVQRMLERIGFRYIERIDPFDGGPHFEAKVEDVALVRKFKMARVHPEELEVAAQDSLVAVERDTGRNRFRAVRCQVRLDDRSAMLPGSAKELLEAESGMKVACIPFE